MLYPENVADKLGFTEVKELLIKECLSSMGQSLVDSMQLLTNYDLINKLLNQTLEFKTILEYDTPPPNQNFFEITHLIQKIKIEGSFLSEEEFFKIALVLTTIFQTIKYFKEREELYPQLFLLFDNLVIEADILREIALVIDNKGKIRNDASIELKSLTTKILNTESEARKRLDIIYKNALREGWSADGSLTIRDGRLVIPILAEYKRKIKGYIHDESATGQTVYLEPTDVFELNNMVRDLGFERRREITRILTSLTNEVRPYASLLESYRNLLAKIDFIRAKALLALRLKANMPILKQEPYFNLVNTYHPLLLISHHHEVVPLNIKVDETGRIILVSGPNAGGKSVCMKTVGLLQIMLQHGMLVPTSSHSEMGIFKRILVDIGDDQSIESDLSTYSAHLTKMKNFVEKANYHTMVLIDEFGTGTDPQFGGPISEAVLEILNQKKVKGVITTHYSNLKLFASNTDGVENASMLFDNVNLKPMYVLQIGKPGSSYALEIAQKIGLPPYLLQLARTKIGEEQKKVENLLVDLEREKKEIYDAQIDIKKRQNRVNDLLEENKRLKEYYEENKRNLLNEAKRQAQEIIRGANKLIENSISEIKSSKADKEVTKQVRQNITQQQQKLQEQVAKQQKIEVVSSALEKGDWIKLQNSEVIGRIIDLNKDSATVAIGDLLSVVKINRLTKVKHQESSTKEKSSYAEYKLHQQSSFNNELDIRGMRGDDALSELEKYLDKALMIGASNLRILHGKGDGILRKLVRSYLKKYSEVDSITDEHADRGGVGVTLVSIK